jgi:hypothetical protein
MSPAAVRAFCTFRFVPCRAGRPGGWTATKEGEKTAGLAAHFRRRRVRSRRTRAGPPDTVSVLHLVNLSPLFKLDALRTSCRSPSRAPVLPGPSAVAPRKPPEAGCRAPKEELFKVLNPRALAEPKMPDLLELTGADASPRGAETPETYPVPTTSGPGPAAFPDRSRCPPRGPKSLCLERSPPFPGTREALAQTMRDAFCGPGDIVLSSSCTSVGPTRSSASRSKKGTPAAAWLAFSIKLVLKSRQPAESRVDLDHAYLNLYTQLSTVMDAFTIISSKVSPNSDVGRTIIMNHQRLKCLSKRTVVSQLSAIAAMVAEFAASLVQFSSLSVGDQAIILLWSTRSCSSGL